jgi:hypothetical protein
MMPPTKKSYRLGPLLPPCSSTNKNVDGTAQVHGKLQDFGAYAFRSMLITVQGHTAGNRLHDMQCHAYQTL